MTLSTRARRLLDLEADKHAAIDNEVEDKGDETSDLIYELATNPEERDPGLWQFLGADPAIAMQDFFLIPVVERDAEWADEFSAMLAASFYQAFWEMYGIDFIESVERRNGRIVGAVDGMGRGEIKEAGKAGFGKKDVQAARERRRAVS